jgi:hypothetical protein
MPAMVLGVYIDAHESGCSRNNLHITTMLRSHSYHSSQRPEKGSCFHEVNSLS